MTTRTITIRGLPDAVLRTLRKAAASSHRSLNAEVLSILEQATAAGGPPPAQRVRESGTVTYRAATKRNRTPHHLPTDRKILAAVCQRFHISRLALFGSWARGEAQPESDVDVVVEFEPGHAPGLDVVAAERALRDAFGGRPVDLVTWRGLRPGLRDVILADAVALHGD